MRRGNGLAAVICALAGVIPALGQGADIRGVSLGGWLSIEKWMTPSLFANTTAEDEWHLCNELGKDACLSTLQQHWNTFYTRGDLVDIKNAGLNTLRIPISYWAIDLLDYEPYVSGQFPYLVRAVQWANELGLSVMISMHGAPGSQNGAETSGLIGPVEFYTNTSNVDRTLNVLKNLTAEFSQDIYGGTVNSISLLNEPALYTANFSLPQLRDFYTQGWNVVKNVSSSVTVVLADGFQGPALWENYQPENGQLTGDYQLDAHQFYAFPPNIELGKDAIIEDICTLSQLLKTNASITGVPQTVIGEWSLQSGVGVGNTSAGLTQSDRTWLRLMFEAQIAAYSSSGSGQASAGYIFWSWKTESDGPTWSYRRGISSQWIPADVSDRKQFVYPIQENGCVDSTFNYKAPKEVTPFNASVWANNDHDTLASSPSSSGDSSASASATSPSATPASKTGKSAAVRVSEVSFVSIFTAWVAIGIAGL